MANLIKNEVAFVPAVDTQWYKDTLLKSVTLERGYVRTIPNVHKSVLLKKLSATSVLSQQDNRDCAWDPKQALKAESTEVNVARYKINGEICLDELDSIYAEESLRSTTHDHTDLPGGDFKEAVGTMLQTQLGNEIEQFIWNGLTAAAAASTETKKVASQVDDVVNEIIQTYLAIPASVLGIGQADDRMRAKIFISPETYKKLLVAIAQGPDTVGGLTTQYVPGFYKENGVLFYLGVEIVAIPNLSGYALAFAPENAAYVCDLLSDAEIKIAGGNSLKDDNIVYVKAQYAAAATFAVMKEVVITTEA